MNQNLYPHLFQPLTIRGVTLKNRLEYAPTVVLKCNADGTVGQDMLDFMAWQAKTGAGWVTVGDTPVTHDKMVPKFLRSWPMRAGATERLRMVHPLLLFLQKDR